MTKIKILLGVLLLFSLFSCEDDAVETVSFGNENYVLTAEAELDVIINLSSPASANISIPVTYGGTAVLNEDFTATETVSVAQGESTATISLVLGDLYETGKTIEISLGDVEGYTPGDIVTATVVITPKEQYIYNFEKAYDILANSLEVTISLLDNKGQTANPSSPITIPFEIAAESTATLGTQFSIDGDATSFIVETGENSASITLKYIEDTLPGDELIIAIPDMGEQFIAGSIDKMVIRVYGFSIGAIYGQWQGVSLSNQSYMTETAIMYGAPTDTVGLPTNISDNTLTISAAEADLLEITGSGDAANYFRNTTIEYQETRTFTYAEEREGWGPPPTHDLAVFALTSANINFSATNENLQTVEVGFRVFTNDEDEEILEATIYQYAPTDFYKTIYDMWFSMDDTNLYPLGDDPVRLQFKRVTE